MEKIKDYNLWVDRVCKYIEEVGPIINAPSSAMQSAPVLDKSPDVIFLGHDAREPFDFNGADKNRFFVGNSEFIPNRHEWVMWNRLDKAFRRNGLERFVTDGNFMLMNLFFLGADNISSFHRKMKYEVMKECINFTEELIHNIIKPKLIICFSVNHVFNCLASKMVNIEQINLTIPNNVKIGHWNGIPVIGIPHPSSRGLSNAYWSEISNFIKEKFLI